MALLTNELRLKNSSALQPQKWQLISMSWWYRSALCGHPLMVLMDNWTRGAASRHTTAPVSHDRPSRCTPYQVSYYSFPSLLKAGGWAGLINGSSKVWKQMETAGATWLRWAWCFSWHSTSSVRTSTAGKHTVHQCYFVNDNENCNENDLNNDS